MRINNKGSIIIVRSTKLAVFVFWFVTIIIIISDNIPKHTLTITIYTKYVIVQNSYRPLFPLNESIDFVQSHKNIQEIQLFSLRRMTIKNFTLTQARIISSLLYHALFAFVVKSLYPNNFCNFSILSFFNLSIF